jgi:hypothetical protein
MYTKMDRYINNNSNYDDQHISEVYFPGISVTTIQCGKFQHVREVKKTENIKQWQMMLVLLL